MARAAYQVGLIGAGLIAGSRVPALRTAGLEVMGVAARRGSARVQGFAERYQIPKVFADWCDLLAEASRFDALVLSTWPDGTPEILESAIALGKPILVEKPVAWNTARHRALRTLPHDHVIVGYNRRFYRSVQEARAEVRGGPPVLAQLTLPTDAAAPEIPDPQGRYMQEFYESVSALGLDLTRFIFGDLTVETVRRIHNGAGNVAGLAAVLSTARGDIVQVTGNWATAANYSLTVNRPGRRFELLPFEIASIYEGLQIHEASPEYPIRRYLPKLVARYAMEGIDLKEKPGFVAEAEALKSMMAGGQPPPFTARLEDAEAVTALCEALTGVVLGDVNPNR